MPVTLASVPVNPQTPPSSLEELAAIHDNLLRQAVPVMAAMERTTSAEGLARLDAIETAMLEVRDAIRSGISAQILEQAWYGSPSPARRALSLVTDRSVALILEAVRS